ncbi:MAG TPA: L-histidine N(alpha)-methyltransferase [Terriglobales bacterium]|jgi:L-histidine N-alpha-methyltransferase|nr:L-histidine N(alpha)-methyltransferase [Terriglobales bacterium]
MIARELISLPSFAEDVELGLSSSPKTLPCKLFYDQAGSALFEQITRLPEYYPTRTELEILRDRGGEIANQVRPGVTVVELGSGTATKTTTLLQAFSRRQLRVPYFPVDISPAALAEARMRVESQCPRVSVRPVVADFSHGFDFLRDIPGRKLVLYLGSSIGNFDPGPAVAMLSQIRSQLAVGDALLLGTDLVKDPSILVPAYDDAQGVTEQFDKNILARLNRELGANFNLDFFRHIAIWNAEQSRMEISLVSLRPQLVDLGLLNRQVRFANGERIHTESSYKYTMPMVREMLERSGFSLDATWFDRQTWFALHLARV